MRRDMPPTPVPVDVEPPAYLARVPTEVLTSTRPGVLARYLHARHWHPTGEQLAAERRRRQADHHPERNTDE